MEHIIYNSECEDTDEEVINGILENDPTKKREDITDEMLWQERADRTEQWYDVERCNLNKPTEGRILLIACMGLWTGKHSGYKIIETRNLKEVLQASCRDSLAYKVYFDGHNVCAKDGHHDGTNCYTFREIREDKDIDVLLCKIYEGKATRADINRYTRSLGRYVKEIYGWGNGGKAKERKPLAVAA